MCILCSLIANIGPKFFETIEDAFEKASHRPRLRI
jgi:hypothetical protein